MPIDYRCSRCFLVFQVGRFHYQLFPSDYGACTLVVCRNCGTQHAIEHSIKNSGKKDRLLFLMKPVRSIEQEGAAEERTMCVLERHQFESGEEADLKTIKDVRCKFCNSKGTLTQKWKKKYKCPHCGGNIEDINIWMT